MQTFRPADVDLAVGPDGGDLGMTSGAGTRVTRSAIRLQSADGRVRSGVWESATGEHDFLFVTDEWAYILEGEAQVTAGGTTRVLHAGDVFYTPAGEPMTWMVPTYVRKVWVHLRPPLPSRIKRKVRGLIAARRRRR